MDDPRMNMGILEGSVYHCSTAVDVYMAVVYELLPWPFQYIPAKLTEGNHFVAIEKQTILKTQEYLRRSHGPYGPPNAHDQYNLRRFDKISYDDHVLLA